MGLIPEDDRDDAYDRHADALAHLPDNIFQSVRHMPTILAVTEGERMMRFVETNKQIVKSIWGKNHDRLSD